MSDEAWTAEDVCKTMASGMYSKMVCKCGHPLASHPKAGKCTECKDLSCACCYVFRMKDEDPSGTTEGRGKTMESNQPKESVKPAPDSKPAESAPTTKGQSLRVQMEGLRSVIEGLRRENAGLRSEVAIAQAEQAAVRKQYQTLCDTWNAKQAGLNTSRLESVAVLTAKGEMARRLAEKLLRWVHEPDSSQDARREEEGEE